jgi:hypothetical protein
MTKPSRRTMLVALAAVPIAGVPTLAGGAAHPDAELLRLGEEFERRYAASLPFTADRKQREEKFTDDWKSRELSIGEWRQLSEATGFEAAIDAETRAVDLIEAVTSKIRKTPAKTFAGLAVKARALRFDAHLSTMCDLPPEDQDWPEYVMNEFVAEIDRLAAAELSEPPGSNG